MKRSSSKVREKAKKFKTQNKAFVNSLNLDSNPPTSNKEFFSVVLKTLKEKPESKELLFFNPNYPLHKYSVVPNIQYLIKDKTKIISSQTVVNSRLDRMDISSSRNFDLKLNSICTTGPEFIVLSTNPMPHAATWPRELQYYFKALSKTYKFRIDYKYSDSFIFPFSKVELIKENVLTFLSMGKESLWSLNITLRNNNLRKIVVVFVNNANFGSNSREYNKFIQFSDWFSRNNIDSRVSFETVEYNLGLLGVQNKEENLKVNFEKPKEPLAKIQYMQLLCVPLIRQHRCGLFVAPMDFEEKNCTDCSHFGDQPVSYLSFNNFFCKYIGGDIKLKFNGLSVSRKDKIIHLIKIDWFKFVSSCYMNWNFFEMYRSINKMELNLNMCGSCWKCKEDLVLYFGLMIVI